MEKTKAIKAVRKLYNILDEYDSDDVEGLQALQTVIEDIDSTNEKQAIKSMAWKLRLANKIIETFNLEEGEMIEGNEVSRLVNVGKKSLSVNIEL